MMTLRIIKIKQTFYFFKWGFASLVWTLHTTLKQAVWFLALLHLIPVFVVCQSKFQCPQGDNNRV